MPGLRTPIGMLDIGKGAGPGSAQRGRRQVARTELPASVIHLAAPAQGRDPFTTRQANGRVIETRGPQPGGEADSPEPTNMKTTRYRRACRIPCRMDRHGSRDGRVCRRALCIGHRPAYETARRPQCVSKSRRLARTKPARLSLPTHTAVGRIYQYIMEKAGRGEEINARANP